MSKWTAPRPLAALGLAALLGGPLLAQERRPADQTFSFRTSVDLVTVNATVTDSRGQFVSGLRAEDFRITEDGEAQRITQFEAERVPVSLGIVLDTSGSMAGEKMEAAREALRRFVQDLLGPDDEMFLYRFDNRAVLIQGWTEDRARLMRGLGSIRPGGETALYDAVAEAVPLAKLGTRRKKALVVISDGNDTGSDVEVDELQQMIRESEVMVYAIGIDAAAGRRQEPDPPTILPFPGAPVPPQRPRGPTQGSRPRWGADGRVNTRALRMVTDDSGGRTEIVAGAQNLDQATAGIANELSRQYFLAYVSTRPKDGRWHAITVETTQGTHRVRARRGFIAN